MQINHNQVTYYKMMNTNKSSALQSHKIEFLVLLFVCSLSLISCFKRVDNPLLALNNKTPGVTIIIISSLLVSESGTTDSFSIVLDAAPKDDVTLTATSTLSAEGIIIAPASGIITFTPQNWSLPQIITVKGVDDIVPDGNQPFSVTFSTTSSLDPSYNGTFQPADVVFTNVDNDTGGVTVTASSTIMISESGTTGSFSIVLNTMPSGDVSIDLTINDPLEGFFTLTSYATSTLTFNPLNWNSPQTVTVQGVDDNTIDGFKNFKIIFGYTSSTDPNYNGIFKPADINITNIDNDIPGLTISKRTLITKEHPLENITDFFTINLNTSPSSPVTVTITSTSTGIEISLSTTTLVFDSSDWNIPKTVTISGKDDLISDGMQTATVNLLFNSVDIYYNSSTTVTVYNQDNESNSIVVIPLTDLLTSESETFADFNVFLSSAPSGTSTVMIGPITTSTTTEGILLSSSTLSFDFSNWNIPQLVRVQGAADNGDVSSASGTPYTLSMGYASSTDPDWDGLSGEIFQLYNLDVGYIPINLYNRSISTSTTYTSIALTGQPINFLKIIPTTPAYDEGVKKIPIGFNFSFLGNYYSEIKVYTNGFASFATTTAATTTPYKDSSNFYAAGTPILALAPWWDDLYFSSSFIGQDSNIYFEQSGIIPSRVLTIEWHNVIVKNATSTDYYSFQIKLNELDRSIEFVYGTSTIGSDVVNARCGIKDETGGSDFTFIDCYGMKTFASSTATSTPLKGNIDFFNFLSYPSIKFTP